MTLAGEKNLKETAEVLVARGMKLGATQVEASVSRGNKFSASVRDGDIEKLEEAGTRSISIRVWVEGRKAAASTSDFREETLQKLLRNAIERARLSEADPFAGLPDKEPVSADWREMKIYDPEVENITPEKMVAWARQAESLAMADKRIKKSTGSSFYSQVLETALANSKGFAGSYKMSRCSCGVGLQAGEGQNLFQDGWSDSSTGLSGLMPPEELARVAVERTARLVGARKVESKNVPVVFEPPMTASLLGFLGSCIAGRAVSQKQSFLEGKLGEKVGSDLVSVIDDGLMPGGMGTSPFDGEGVPAKKTTVFEKGVLKSYLLDSYSARKLKMAGTGNASGPTNFYMAAGASTPSEIIRSVDAGLLLTGTMGQGTVPTTGDISRGAFGLWIEKGEIAYPVSEITISGNLGAILKGITMVGTDPDFKRQVTGPTIKVAELTLGGR